VDREQQDTRLPLQPVKEGHDGSRRYQEDDPVKQTPGATSAVGAMPHQVRAGTANQEAGLSQLMADDALSQTMCLLQAATAIKGKPVCSADRQTSQLTSAPPGV
jgi:hypothetical protein